MNDLIVSLWRVHQKIKGTGTLALMPPKDENTIELRVTWFMETGETHVFHKVINWMEIENSYVDLMEAFVKDANYHYDRVTVNG